MKPHGRDSIYDVLRDHFDVAYYLLRNRGIAEAQHLDPLHHYIHHGAEEGRDPAPYFNTQYYLSRYPDVAESRHNPFYHYIRWGKAQGRAPNPYSADDTDFQRFCADHGRSPEQLEAHVSKKRDDLRRRLEFGELGEMAAKAAQLEPLIAHSWPNALNIHFPPLNRVNHLSAINILRACHEELGRRPANAVIAVNKPRWGCSPRMEGYIASALAERFGVDRVVVIYTDSSGEACKGRFPDGVRTLDFAQLADGLPAADRERVFVELVRSLSADIAININSKLFWSVLGPYGKAMACSMKIYAGLFCGEKNAHGFWHGHPYQQFYRHFETLSGIFTDSHALADTLTEQFMLPDDQRAKLTVLSAPVDSAIPVARAPRAERGRRPQVFWAGRFDRQKRIDIVYTVARRMPDVDFRLWGQAVLDRSAEAHTKPHNVSIEGVYGALSELPLEKADAWLYTSEWDGVPSVLLEIGMSGVPLVGSRVGGTGEVLKPGLASPVDAINDAARYETALRQIFADPARARDKARRLRAELVQTRSAARYRNTLDAAIDGAPAGG